MRSSGSRHTSDYGSEESWFEPRMGNSLVSARVCRSRVGLVPETTLRRFRRGIGACSAGPDHRGREPAPRSGHPRADAPLISGGSQLGVISGCLLEAR